MTPPLFHARNAWRDALVATVLATVLGWLSGALFANSHGVLLKWLPNVVAVMFAFHRPGRSFAAVLAGHAAGLVLAGFIEDGGASLRQVFHVAADLLETALMIGALAWITGDGRLRRSGEFGRISLFVVLLPALVGAAAFGLGLWVLGQPWANLTPLWFTASIGMSTIVLVPWLVARSPLDDAPLSSVDLRGRVLRLSISALLICVALILPLLGYTQDDALVALMVLMASVWLPLRVVALLFVALLALHDADVRPLLGLPPPPSTANPVWDALHAALVALAALYVRLLIGENRSALAEAKRSSHQLANTMTSLDQLALRHHLALKAGGIGVWETDLATGESEWDSTMYRLFGAAPETLVSPRTLMQQRLTPESILRAREAIRGVRQGNSASYIADYTVTLPDGEVRQLRSVVARMENANGRSAMVGATWDCSMEYIAKESLRTRAEELAGVLQTESLRGLEARGRAAKAEAMQNDFVANVSHELRTPLHAIMGFLDLAQEDLGNHDVLNIDQALHRIERSRLAAKRLLAQVDDLLDLAKLEDGTTRLQRRPIEIAQVLTPIVEELGAMLQAKRQRITVTGPLVSAGLPAPSPRIDADEVRLMQVFRNLLANAVRFSPEGGVIGIEWSLEDSEAGARRILFNVRDEGPGIAESELEAVFGKFMQVRGARTKAEGGTGLGLTIARQIARAHGGDLVALASTRGAWFQLSLPLTLQSQN